ncbi:S-layer homology domain-containing protein [Tumebacillus sp. DT12]|uniref:S-layer homology domain-containing protein n=1 Tax=Tumebacillus lacus TaxID=2995335 RepID=A0ABT3WXW0_9BACL|nr:S-layer homology domain-containing protein [Tumebacillus lacus]MCX7569507.1 S-layer homology domain-containing protein [Tumebacillus lacus]
MAFLRHKLLHLIVILAMVITLLPIGVTQAANEYFRFTNFSIDPAYPTQVNRNLVDLVGTFNGVSSNSIGYRVEQLVNGAVVNSNEGTGVRPTIENGSTFKFFNVPLFQGLNRITVTGTNSSGNTVPGVAYVNFSNVPVIYDVKLVDGRALEAGVPLVVDSPNAVLMLKAPNAENVSVNGINAYSAGADNFIISDLPLQPGLNALAIVASNRTMKYSLNRSLVYYNGYPTAYDVKVYNGAGNPQNTPLEGNPTVGPNNGGTALTGQIQGKLVYFYDNSLPSGYTPTISLRLIDEANAQTPFTATVQPGVNDGTHMTFDFVSNETLNLPTNGKYRIEVIGSYGTQTAQFPIYFSYRNSNTAYFTELNQLYNVNVSATNVVTYGSSTVFAGNSMLFETPVWLEAKLNNFAATADLSTVRLFSTINGVEDPNFQATEYLTSDKNVAYKITNMTAGEQTLTVEVVSGGNTERKSVKINYIPAPFIQMNNLHDGKVFIDNEPLVNPATQNPKMFSHIAGRLVNFNLAPGSADLNSINVKINGYTVRLIDHLYGAIDANGNFIFDPPAEMELVDGPNAISFEGVANGIPIATSLTVYKFSDQVPLITSIKPVPYDPLVPQMDDPNIKFKNVGTLDYVTNEKVADVIFTVQNAKKVIVNVDGNQVALAEDDGSGNLIPNNATLRVDSYDAASRTYHFRIPNHQLPNTGLRNIVIQATLESATASQTLQITRELSPYIILSPKLPNERVINQNFLDVSILAEGADQVLVGKESAVKDEHDIFRLQLKNLKAGLNKIKFTVVRGTQKLNGEIEVNYAASSTIGAQYKTTMPKSGTLKVFDSQLALTFPKGTLLRKANTRPGQDQTTVDLFDRQNILFGIADRTDGRTLKKYNRVGEIEGGLPKDGEIKDVLSEDIATNLLQPRAHFAFASNLFWIDAGYFDSSSLTQWKTVDGQHPYQPGFQFYLRSSKDKWMEPSQRGQITLKYDPYIRDVIAKKLSIWRFVDNTWVNLGGVVDTGRKEVTAPFDGFGYYAVFEDAYSFADIIGHPWARNQLELMFSKGIMEEKNNNEFGVYDNITRGEFATMLVKMLDIPLSYDPKNLTFNDVPPVIVHPSLNGDYRYIETAVKRGIIRGLGPRIFGPAAPLSREQGAVMIARAMNLVKTEDEKKDLAALQKSFTDAGTVDYYARASVVAVTKAGIILGRTNELLPGQKNVTLRFDPHAFLTRAEAAVMSERILRKIKKL